MSLYYLSFCEPSGWKGAAFIEADGVVEAQGRADDEEISPGGKDLQVLAFQYDNLEDVPEVPPTMRNRRLGKEELLALWPDAGDLMEYDDHA
jgi:hypothetical protein